MKFFFPFLSFSSASTSAQLEQLQEGESSSFKVCNTRRGFFLLLLRAKFALHHKSTLKASFLSCQTARLFHYLSLKNMLNCVLNLVMNLDSSISVVEKKRTFQALGSFSFRGGSSEAEAMASRLEVGVKNERIFYPKLFLPSNLLHAYRQTQPSLLQLAVYFFLDLEF